MASIDSSWLSTHNPDSETRLRLFCLPHAGGGAAAFSSWWEILPPEMELYVARLPGRETRIAEAPFTQLHPLVQELARVLRPYMDMPFAFFGHSMGALLSFEVARHLRREGCPCPSHLFVSGYRAPHLAPSTPTLHHLPEREFVEQIGLLNGIPQQVLESEELMRLLLPTLRADFTVCEAYEYSVEQPLKNPISAFYGVQDPLVSENEMAAWEAHTHSSFSLRRFHGDHSLLDCARMPILKSIAQDVGLKAL